MKSPQEVRSLESVVRGPKTRNHKSLGSRQKAVGGGQKEDLESLIAQAYSQGFAVHGDIELSLEAFSDHVNRIIANPTWKPSTFLGSQHPTDLFFVDRNRGWIVSDDGSLLGSSPNLHSTTDGGNSWQTTDLKMEGKPVRVRFVNAKTGLLLTHYASPRQTKTSSELYYCENGDSNWRSLVRFDRRIGDLCVLDRKRFIVAGEGGFIANTDDAGNNWRRSITRSRSFINCVRFYDNKNAIAVGDYSTVLLSTDAGETWEKVQKPSAIEHFISATLTSPFAGMLVASDALFSFKFS